MSLNWSVEEQEEVKKFFKINNLELELWPKLSELSVSNSAILEEDDSDNESKSGSATLTSSENIKAISNGSFVVEGGILMTESMAGAKNLLDEVKDPLGINDSLYQMQVQRILLDPKYNQPTVPDSATPSILLSSPNFDARLCLRLVHQYTSYADLVRAIDHLNESVQTRKNVLKFLVRENFDRFVNAKNSIDSVYADMRAKGMNSGDYGMRPATASVNGALEKSQQVYHPLLKRRSREECIRKRLSVFQEYKAIFNLPATLHQHIKLGEFQQCVYAYRRGKELFLTEPAYSTLKPILESVWTLQVEKAASGLRNVLFEKLANPVYPYDVQSKIIGYLFELEASPDPIIFYYNTKSSHVMRQCQSFQDEAVKSIELNLLQPKASQLEDHVAALLRDTLRIIGSRVYEDLSGLSYPVVREWKIITEAFNQLSGQLKSILVPMAKITSQNFEKSRQKEIYPKKLEESVKLIVESFESNVDSIFSSVMGQSGHVDNSLVGMYFTLRIIRQMGETFAAILDTSPHPIMSNGIKSSFSHVLNTLVSRIWMTAVIDCRNLGIIEDWKLYSSPSTALVRSFENLLAFLVNGTMTCRKIFYEVVQDQTLVPLQGIDGWFSKSFTEFIIEGMYRHVRPIDGSNTVIDQEFNAGSADLTILDEIGRENSVDLLKLNLPARLLVVLANVSYLQGEGLRNLCSLFTNENVPLSPTCIVSALTNVERAVTQLFLQGQIGKIIDPINESWLRGSSVANDMVSLSPAIFKSLLALSDVQCLICDVSPKDPIPLLRDLSCSLLSCILAVLKQQSNNSNSKDQMIQAKIDVEFLRRKLDKASLLSPESHEILDRITLILDEFEVKVDFYAIWGQFEANWTESFSNLFSF